jgi:hypothetical protein
MRDDVVVVKSHWDSRTLSARFLSQHRICAVSSSPLLCPEVGIHVAENTIACARP